MKKVKFDGKLSLNKETVAKLNDEQMKSINGGWTVLPPFTFTVSATVCTTGSNTSLRCSSGPV